jgi:hypothetical protein
MQIKRNINGIEMSIKLTDEEVVQFIAEKPIDERVVFFRKLAQLDLKSFDIFNILKSEEV